MQCNETALAFHSEAHNCHKSYTCKSFSLHLRPGKKEYLFRKIKVYLFQKIKVWCTGMKYVCSFCFFLMNFLWINRHCLIWNYRSCKKTIYLYSLNQMKTIFHQILVCKHINPLICINYVCMCRLVLFSQNEFVAKTVAKACPIWRKLFKLCHCLEWISNEPRYVKTCLSHMRTLTKAQISLRIQNPKCQD